MERLKDCRARGGRQRICVLAVILALMLATSMLFMVEPEIDVRFSALFYDGSGFPAAGNIHLQLLRRANEVVGGIVLVAAALLLCSGRLRRRAGLRIGDVLLPILTYGLGVGLIVNGILKEYFGRARPRDIVEFGGGDIFTAAWTVSDACQTNCSFTSGEAAGAIAVYSAMALLAGLSLALRVVAATLMGIFAAAISLNRIAFGAHFLSDVLLSFLLVLALMISARILVESWMEPVETKLNNS
jgi:lipid A 4'-phosphatase